MYLSCAFVKFAHSSEAELKQAPHGLADELPRKASTNGQIAACLSSPMLLEK